MAAGNYNILIEQGATFFVTLTLKDVNAYPLDLTGLTFTGQLKKAFTDSVATADFVCNVLDQTNPAYVGQVEVSLSPTITAALVTSATGTVRTLTTLVYDIESQNAVTGEVLRWLQGEAKVSPEVTK